MALEWIKEELEKEKLLGLKTYKSFLLNEINILKSKIQPHDTGYIHTAIGVLNDRCKEIDQQIYEVDNA